MQDFFFACIIRIEAEVVFAQSSIGNNKIQ